MCKPLGIIASCVALSCAATIASALDITSPEKQEMLPLALRGVHFVPNHGQWADARVHFGLRSRGLDVAFRESAFTMHLARQAGSEGRGRIDQLTPSLDPMLLHSGDSPGDRTDFEHLTLTVSFPGSNSVVPEGGKPQTAKFNYFVGGEGRGMASDVPSFGAIVYHNLYDGVDLHVMGSDDGVLKYEFHVAPGADYGQIRVAYDGIDGLCIDDRDGDMRIATSLGTLRDNAPIVWQTDPSLTLRSRFDLLDHRTYTIALDAGLDPSQPLIIDPELEWMYYLGGSSWDENWSVAVDSTGGALVTGWTQSLDFAGRNNSHYGDRDAYALKVSPSGELQWMTYLGGSGSEFGIGIAVDSAGDALVTGSTSSSDFAGRNNNFYGEFTDAFALKVSSAGQLQWMTYLGGSGDDDGDRVDVDSAGNALLTGTTSSTDFNGRTNTHHGGFADAFAIKLSSSGDLQWMTYLGGGDEDRGSGIAVDGAGDALVTGSTSSTDFGGRNNNYYGGFTDAFALKVSSSGQLLWMAYLGGSDVDDESSVAVDSDGNALVAGLTYSTDFAGRNNSSYGGSQDAFALKVGPSGQLDWMTYLGGSETDVGWAIAADSDGNALVTGATSSTDFAGRNNSYNGGGSDAFALKVSPSGELLWMVNLGGSSDDFGYGIVADQSNTALVTGTTRSRGFVGRRNSYYGGAYDAFILKLSLENSGPRLTVGAACPNGGPIGISWEGATPDGQVAVIFARDTGSFTIPPLNPCAGTRLGLGSNQLQIAFQGSAGSSGSRTINGTAPPGACGGYMQLLDVATCTTSNVVPVE